MMPATTKSERTIEGLKWLEAAMRRKRLRAHVYLVNGGTTIALATRARVQQADRQEILGPQPISEALKEIKSRHNWRPDWTALQEATADGTLIVPTVWNSAHLVVSGVSAAHALIMAAPNAKEHDAETVRRLAAKANARTGSEVADWYRDATTTELPGAALEELNKILDKKVIPPEHQATGRTDVIDHTNQGPAKRDTRVPNITRRLHDILQQVGDALRKDGFQGSVFLLPTGAVIAFTSTTWRTHNCRYNIGRQPLMNRLSEALGNESVDATTWLSTLRAELPKNLPRPRTLWNRPELVVTEVMSPDRLLTVFEHPESWAPENLAEIADQVGISNVKDLERMFQQATTRALPANARRHYMKNVAPIKLQQSK